MSKQALTDLIHNPSCMDEYDPNSMPVNQARTLIRQFLTPVATVECLALRSALGRVLAADIISPCNVPNHNNSAMDGYAYNADDTTAEGETTLKVIGTAFAGRPFRGAIGKAECVRIMTGAVLPQGADTVIMQERVQVSGDSLLFSNPPVRAMNVRYAGEDLKQGQTVLPIGHIMRPADLGMIASLGIGEIKVFRKLRVAFFSTGDELISIGQPLLEGQIYDSNRYTLFGMLTRFGVEVIDMGVVGDNPQQLETALINAAASADVVITSGGVSVGEADFMKQLLEKHGQVLFWKISMKPGRPLAYGKVGDAHYFGLPGNPVAAMVSFYQFVREALLNLMGQENPPQQPLLKVTCTEAIKKMAGRTEFQRGQLFIGQDGEWKVKPTGNQGSGILRSMSDANCFIVLPDDTGNLVAGTQVQVQLLEGII
jgi:molybdopterin molybdotransferase